MTDTNGTGSEEKCLHDVSGLRYLKTFLTPHVAKPETLSIAQSLFLCEGCGNTTIVYTQVSRGYLADGSIPPGMQKNLEEMSEKKRIEAQADVLYKQRVASDREKSRQAQLAKMPEPSPGSPN